MNYDEEGDIDFDAWYKKNHEFFPKNVEDTIEEHYDMLLFLYRVYKKGMRHLPPAIHKLLLKHYPSFRTDKRPALKEHLAELSSSTCSSILLRLHRLVEDQKKGKNVRQDNPDFEKWREFYTKPAKPDTIDESTRPEYTWLSDAEWEVFRDSENASMLEYFNWVEKRKFEFIDLIQSVVLKYYKEIEDLNPDEWVLYAMIIRDEYECLKSICEDVEIIVDCKMDEHYLTCPYEEFFQAYSSLSREVKDYTSDLRDRRISGEDV